MTLTTLQKRFLSAIILFPPVIWLVVMGGLFFLGLLIVTFFISIFEWAYMARKTNFPTVMLFLGICYLMLSYGSFFLLRELSEVGLALTVLAFFCVWTSDSLAYIFGKYFKGPKLIPQISPHKTWAGLTGALLGPVLVLFTGDMVMDAMNIENITTNSWAFIWGGMMLGLVGQMGDLLISILKRAAQVKDSGYIIPGHGGLLDRVDSLLLMAPVFFVFAKGVLL